MELSSVSWSPIKDFWKEDEEQRAPGQIKTLLMKILARLKLITETVSFSSPLHPPRCLAFLSFVAVTTWLHM